MHLSIHSSIFDPDLLIKFVFLVYSVLDIFFFYSCLYCIRWCSACALFSSWQFLFTVTPSTLWLALPLPCQGFLFTSWVSIYQSPNDPLWSQSYCVSLSHILHPEATGTLVIWAVSLITLSTMWQQCALVFYCRFPYTLHPVHLLLCTDRDGQKWITSDTLQNYPAVSKSL